MSGMPGMGGMGGIPQNPRSYPGMNGDDSSEPSDVELSSNSSDDDGKNKPKQPSGFNTSGFGAGGFQHPGGFGAGRGGPFQQQGGFGGGHGGHAQHPGGFGSNPNAQQQQFPFSQDRQPGPDLYAILEINRSASQAEIKKAYDKLKVKWHPDRNHSPEATTKFAEVSSAYDVLKDDGRRRFYDETGEVGEEAFRLDEEAMGGMPGMSGMGGMGGGSGRGWGSGGGFGMPGGGF
jgi:hypothetical protein